MIAQIVRHQDMNNRRKLVVALGAVVLVRPMASFAQQQAKKVYRIGMLERTSIAVNASNVNAFRHGMQEFGYVEGRNFVIDYRSVEGRDENYPSLAAELVRLNVDVIIARGTPATLA